MGETTKLIVNRLFSILTGVVAGALIIGLLEMVSHSMHPIPTDLDTSNPDAFKDYVLGLPQSAFIFLLLAHGIGALAGGFIASRMARVQKRGAAMFVGLILVLAGLLNLMAIPHPLWFSIADVIIYTPMALLGDKLRESIFPVK
jgi:hypothetical protein